MEKENLYIGYIDGELSDSQTAELGKILSEEGNEAKKGLFEMKDIADTVRHGSMSIREQERKIAGLISKTEKSEIRKKRKKWVWNVVCYTFIALVAFFAGKLLMPFDVNDEEKSMIIHSSPGNMTELTLPDGTYVILKSSSVLKYDTDRFCKRNREVHLDGEAYFDVANIPDSKFIINTYRQKVTVHGTSFNLNAYNNDKYSTLTLLKGSLSLEFFDVEGNRIRSLDIKQMEKCTWDLHSGKTKVEQITSSEAGLGWNENIFYFENMSITEIAERLEHYYDVNISTFGLDFDNERFSGGLSLNQSLNNILGTLNYDKKFNIKRIDDKHFSISKSKTTKQ